MKRASAVVRAWDGPNSRIAFEMDLDQMPWGPFEALGKQVTFLVPSRPEAEPHAGEAESQLESALRHVEHAAERCAEFAELGNGSDQLWRSSLETWEWLREFLTAAWSGGYSGAGGAGTGSPGAPSPPEVAAPARAAPDMPGAAATLEVAATALRNTPLAVWREAVGTYNPDAPTREEAIHTLLGVARLLGSPARSDTPGGSPAPAPDGSTGLSAASPTAGAGPDEGVAVAQPTSAPAETGARDADSPDEALREHDEASSSGAGTAGAGRAPGAHADAGGGPSGDEALSFEYAAGYDEGYRMGRRVGRALGARERTAGSG